MRTRVLRIIGSVATVLVLLVLLWFSRRVILLLFASLLIALILTSATKLLRKVIPVGHKAGFALVFLLLAGVLSGVGMLVAPSVTDQFSQLAEQVPRLFSDFLERVRNTSFYQRINGSLPNLAEMFPSGGKVTQFFSSTFEAVSGLIFIVFTALFLAATPNLYRRMLIKLFPPRLREAAAETTGRVICTLKYWLLGQFASMLVVGVITGCALAIAGVPLAVALGILAGVAEFIPIFGPIFASIPALLLAASQGTDKFLIVLAIFLVIQFLEGNLIMPLVQRKAINLPPVITLLAILLLGGAFGLLGWFVAAPFAAMVLVLTEDIYLQRYLKTKDKLLT